MELHSHFRFDELARLTTEPFAEKPIDNLASISFCTCLGVRHTVQFNWSGSRKCRNRQGRESADIVTVRNCRNRMHCFDLGASLRRGQKSCRLLEDSFEV